MKRITVVCRANEVRSKVIQAFLASRFPQAIVKSFGVEVDEEKEISRSLVVAASDWGLTLDVTPPRNITSDLNFLSESDLVIAADSSVANNIRNYNASTFDLTNYAIDSEHIPVDPLGFGNSDIQINNAKLIHCVQRFLNARIPLDFTTDITAVIPKEPNVISYLDFDGYIIDARLKHFVIKSHLPHSGILFNGEMLYSGELEGLVSERNKTYAPSAEFHRPEQALLSVQWGNFVQKVSALGPTVVITTPLAGAYTKYPDSYLASALAGKALYI